jgi:Na+/citrate or Na+/malate symporter
MATTIQHNQSGQRIRWTLLSLAGIPCGLIVALAFGVPLQTVVGLLLITPILSGVIGAGFATLASLRSQSGKRS